jgi:hypothetical protein
LLIGIVLLSPIFAWFTLRKGYSANQRFLAFGWLVIMFIAVRAGNGDKLAATTYLTSTSTENHTKPKIPPELPPPFANLADEVPGFEAKLAADEVYQSVWTGPRADLDLFLTYVSELLASGEASIKIADPIGRKKLKDSGIKLYLIFVRVGRFPDDFVRRFSAHLDAVKGEARLGTWTPWKESGDPVHDFTALAMWFRPEDPSYVRERLAARRGDAGPVPWFNLNQDTAPERPWLVSERAALERLALLGPLTSEENARHAALVEAKKQPKLGMDFKLGNFTYNVKGVTSYRSIGSGFTKKRASEGALFVVVEYTILNDSNATATVLTDDFRIMDSQDREYHPSSEANTALIMSGESKDLFVSEVQPGLRKKMQTAFEMPDASARGTFTLVIPEKGLLGTGSVRITFN